MRADGPLVSVIIPHLNQVASLARCLVSIAGQDFPRDRVEIIVVDNGSRVPLVSLRAAWPQVRFLLERAPGPGLARNLGVEHAHGELLLFIDADCRAGAGWLAAGVRALEVRPGSGVVGGDVRIDVADPLRLTALESYESVFAYQQRMYIEHKHFSGTGNLGMWKSVHRAVGGFVGIAFAEDLEWGRRARAKGFVIEYVPDMVIYHPARDTFDQLAAKWRRHVAHDWNAHRAAGRSHARWAFLAAVTLASAAPHALRVMSSDRLSGVANRLKGIGTLARIRAYRMREMLRVPAAQASGRGAAGATSWNRGA